MIYKPTLGQIAAGGFRNHPRYRDCIAHWLMGEGGGLKAFDISGFYKDGTFAAGSGAPTWVGGLFGPALKFDGADLITIPSFTFSSLAAKTVAFWINWSSAPDDVILGGESGHYAPYITTTTINVAGVGGVIANATHNGITQGTWYCFAWTRNASDLFSFYQNGVLLGTESSVTVPTVSTIGSYSGGGFPFAGLLDDFRIYNRALSAAEISSLYNDPFLEFKRVKKFFFNAAVGHTIVVGQVTESNLVQAVTGLKLKALGQISEIDLPQIVTSRKALEIAQATEANLSQIVTRAGQMILVGQSLEIDLAQAVSWSPKRRLVGLVIEADLSQAVTRLKTKALGQVSEASLAQSLTVAKAKQIAQALESDLAQGIVRLKVKLIGLPNELTLVQPITSAKLKVILQASETDLARAIARLKTKAIGQVTESDLAQAIAQAIAEILQLISFDLRFGVKQGEDAWFGIKQSIEPRMGVKQPMDVLF